VDLFRTDFLNLSGLTKHSVLDVVLQAGLSALKTPYELDVAFFCLVVDVLICLSTQVLRRQGLREP
jgi:hypothetical protein